MSKVGDAITKARVKVNAKRAKIFPDLCDLIEVGLESDGFSGSKPKETSRATNIPCRYDEATASPNKLDSGHVGYESTHVLTFGASADTMAITPKYKIKVLANGDRPITIFEQPVRIKGSMQVFVKYRARETTGARAPVNV